jgi:dTDP-4-dehydrorhamnose reductase
VICLITGWHGMIAPRFKEVIEKHGYEVVVFDRSKVNIDSDIAVKRFLKAVNPDLIIHFAYGRIKWTTIMAKYAKAHQKKFVYVSTVNVYGDNKAGNLLVNSPCLPNDEYSRYKRAVEEAVLKTNNEVYIFRLGWQISPLLETHPNNMVSFMKREQNEHGFVLANQNSYLSVSLTKDLVEEMTRIIITMPPDIYLFNSNFSLNFYDLLVKLNDLYHLECVIKAEDGPSFNNLMFDDRVDLSNEFFSK